VLERRELDLQPVRRSGTGGGRATAFGLPNACNQFSEPVPGQVQ